MDLTVIQKLAAYSLPIIFAITVHEAAHGYAAKYFGDMTAFHLNRISLNPLRTHRSAWNDNLARTIIFFTGRFYFWLGKTCPR